ncbi:type I 3-dehydroquinate dehydratase [Anaerotalea alkaliphila]|uniref:3-dehydroquinate dehydratase n=1 Tax=Anaerotalea alkaliphila TaxID=2662126 RepID=A0A7X5KNE2_9FIRM|nr:type I 3-dehydroquinate dehydratase [Anaerotalea alkaliphila]NDL68779.1 type I 3-dehydroquinate dehydratase [Anaerotalea alkaliphila]
MNTVKVKNLVLGEGIPKICVPIVAKTKREIIEEAGSFRAIPVDLVEWRVDWFEGVEDLEQVKDVLSDLVAVLEGTPLLFTFRTAAEGGERAIDPAAYAALNKAVAATGLVDLVDVEAFIGDAVARDIIEAAHGEGVKVVASNHDFGKTPPMDDILYRLRKMQDLGADIPKIAVMPQSRTDVLRLLEATTIMVERYADRPIITMSMAGTGAVSRLAGEVFGSCLTFGAANKASAPGQVGVQELSEALQLIHKSMQ